MKTRAIPPVLVCAAALLLSPVSRAQSKPANGTAGPVLLLGVEQGTVEIELYPKDAPKSVEHILALVKRNFYRGLRFHWVLPGVVQVGDPQSRNMYLQKSWGTLGSGDPIRVAEVGKRPFVRGTVGLAHKGDAAMADSQIFILRSASPNLDGKYTMIGHVIKGMDVVDKIQMADILKTLALKQ
jgi:cyclophilin family peptidyl-prolyl cis-trans isomerase